jgi:hypothetical protein
MTTLSSGSRPDCEKVLSEKNLWALNLNQLMKKKFEIDNQKKSIEENFYSYFIETKIKNAAQFRSNSQFDKCLIS